MNVPYINTLFGKTSFTFDTLIMRWLHRGSKCCKNTAICIKLRPLPTFTGFTDKNYPNVLIRIVLMRRKGEN